MSQSTSKNTKLVIIVVLAIAVIVAVEMYFGFLQHKEVANNVKINGVYLAQANDVQAFHLTDSDGKPFNKKNLQGHWTLVFFGFTNCGMVCPTTMAALADMQKILEKKLPADQLPQVVMVSVDPDRDSVKRMKEYVTAFNPHFIGARGSIAETIELEKQLHIVAAKMEADGHGYTINHSTEILLFNPHGKLQAYFSSPHQPEVMAKDYELIVKTAKSG